MPKWNTIFVFAICFVHSMLNLNSGKSKMSLTINSLVIKKINLINIFFKWCDETIVLGGTVD